MRTLRHIAAPAGSPVWRALKASLLAMAFSFASAMPALAQPFGACPFGAVWTEFYGGPGVGDSWKCTCPPGQAGTVQELVASCSPCPSGTVTNQGRTACVTCGKNEVVGWAGGESSGEATCMCAPGTYVSFYKNDNGSCKPCPAGQIQTSAGQAYCSTCGAGTISSKDHLSCVACAAGTFANTDHSACSYCKPGTYSQDGQSCKKCPAGQISGVAAGSCSKCPQGMISNKSQTACTCNQINAITGPLGCLPCPPQQVANKAHTSCSPCPKGTTFQYGSCGPPPHANTNPVAVPGSAKKSRSPAAPGLLDSRPGLGTQGPGAVGTPLGAGGPAGGARGPAGVR